MWRNGPYFRAAFVPRSRSPTESATVPTARVHFAQEVGDVASPMIGPSAPSMPRSVSVMSRFSNVSLEKADSFALLKLYDHLSILKAQPPLSDSFSNFELVVKRMKSVLMAYHDNPEVAGPHGALIQHFLLTNDLLEAVIYLLKCSSFTHTRSGIQATQYKRRLMTQITKALILQFHEQYMSLNIQNNVTIVTQHLEDFDAADDAAIASIRGTSMSAGVFGKNKAPWGDVQMV